MYNLKEVYATISFDYDKIRLLVVEQKDNGQINCLYYNHLQISYLNEDLSFSSTAKLLDTVDSLIRQADKFLSTNIKRYILNISCLPLKSVNLRSSESLIFGPLTPATATNCVNRVLDSGKNVKEMLLQVIPSK
ncbi:hypothetical protein FACS1894166_02320 [Bacilli bacterium]|nr:hypothetical protein FACS1894166_02320 [Bacilli bacterium]